MKTTIIIIILTIITTALLIAGSGRHEHAELIFANDIARLSLTGDFQLRTGQRLHTDQLGKLYALADGTKSHALILVR